MHGNQAISIEVLLSHVPLFSTLGPKELARVARGTQEIRAARNDFIFRKGDPCRGFHLVIIGRLKLVFTTAEGVEQVVEILGQGQSFGETYMLEGLPYDISAQALTDSILLQVSKAAIFEEFDRDPALRLKMVTGMSRRLRQVMDEVESYSLRSGRQRVANYFLLALGRDAPARNAVLLLPTSKANIASRLNLTQEHFSRILRELSKLSLIVVEGGRIFIPDLQRLRAEAERYA